MEIVKTLLMFFFETQNLLFFNRHTHTMRSICKHIARNVRDSETVFLHFRKANINCTLKYVLHARTSSRYYFRHSKTHLEFSWYPDQALFGLKKTFQQKKGIFQTPYFKIQIKPDYWPRYQKNSKCVSKCLKQYRQTKVIWA